MHALLANVDLPRVLAIAMLVALRLLPLTVLAPWLGLRQAPPMLRAAVLCVLSAALFPAARASVDGDLPIDLLGLVLLGARELLVGLVFALCVSLPLHALGWAGAHVDAWRGASSADVASPSGDGRTSPLGAFYLLLAASVFLAIGGHRLVISALADSFARLPLGAAVRMPSAPVAWGAMRIVADALAVSAAFAAPAAVALVVTEIALGVVGRGAPQIPVFFVGMPLRAALGLGVAAMTLSLCLGRLSGLSRSAIATAETLLNALGP